MSSSSKTLNNTYIIKWRGDCGAWFMRGIKPDRSFYGEITDERLRVQRNIEGRLSQQHYDNIVFLIDRIKQSVSEEMLSAETWDGMLAEGTVSKPCILFRYRKRASPSLLDDAFLEIVGILREYLQVES